MTLMDAKRVGMAWEYEKQIVVLVGSLENRVSKKILPENQTEFYDMINFILMNHL